MDIQNKNVCNVCGRSIDDYNKKWPCAKNHKWQGKWRFDKTTEKYAKYLERRKQSMQDQVRKKLELLNKKTPAEYKSRIR